MNSRFYVLDEQKNPVPCDADEWSRFFEAQELGRRVGSTNTRLFWISTIFLGINRRLVFSYTPEQEELPPLTFETSVFELNPALRYASPEIAKIIEFAEDFQDRYSTWQEAESAHNTAVGLIRALEAKASAEIDKFMVMGVPET